MQRLPLLVPLAYLSSMQQIFIILLSNLSTRVFKCISEYNYGAKANLIVLITAKMKFWL